MSWTIESTTLKVNSESVSRDDTGVLKLTLGGILKTSGSDKDALMAATIAPILALVSVIEVFPVEGAYPVIVVLKGQESTIASPGGRYNGEWVLTNAEFNATSDDNKDAYNYTLTLVQGSSHEVL